ncbi:MAG: transporter-like protein [Deltaproteobacteria bacterium]|nr:transporter-like protein [Deltaproteobacteria bacterium]
MLRATWLTVQNEARLLRKDPIVLFMLLLAPVVIITVAGYSLGNLYGNGSNTVHVPIIDRDRGQVAAAIIDALGRERAVAVERVADTTDAQTLVRTRDRTPLAIEIPPGTSNAIAEGRPASLILYVDPVRRLEVNQLELRLADFCRSLSAAAQATAQQRLADSAADLRAQLKRLATALTKERLQIQQELAQQQAAIVASINAQVGNGIRQVAREIETTVRMHEQQAWGELQRQLSARQEILLKVQRYLVELQASQNGFEIWLETLKERAGRHASDIPPPPAFPVPPSEAALAELARPITPPSFASLPPRSSLLPSLALKVPALSPGSEGELASELGSLRDASVPALPGTLGLIERPAVEGGSVAISAFDQYVPGFGVTFLLIGMLLGISLTLFDEREWGTLKRLQVSGVPLAGVLLGKLSARFVVGTVQMTILFVVGWALFGISLGRHPFALGFPIVSMSFAAAAFGLVIAAVARAHDSVMPLGTVSSMAMSAIGGCWWPLDFEPGWMRAIAWSLPTTWTMQVFNDLMIRNQPASSVLWPCAVTMSIGCLFLAIGLCAFLKLNK